MTVHIKLFPIAGVCNQSQELELILEEGKLGEVLANLHERLGVNLAVKLEKLMLLHNGCALGNRKDVAFQDGDRLWLLPLLSGG